MSTDDALRAAGLLTLGENPPAEAVGRVVDRLGELARGSDRDDLLVLRAGAWRILEPLGVAADALDDTLGITNGARLPEPVAVRLSDVEPQRVSWLWPGRIPLGRLTILDGDPGLGKSSVTLDLTARTTRAWAMPDGSTGLDGPRGVVLMGVEDGLADTVRPRLDAAGADVSRVIALTGIRDGEGHPRLPTVADVMAIRATAEAVDAALLIVDPLSAYLGRGVDGHRDTEVRQALADLAALAESTGLAVLCIRHLSKAGGANPLYRGGGSIAIIAAARSGLLLARDPEEDDRLVLAQTKCNLAPRQESLSLSLDSSGDALRIRWHGTSARSASDLLVVVDGEERTARDEAVELLRSELEDGPRSVADLKAATRDAGMSWRTIERAKASLGIIAEQVRRDGRVRGWCWRLPDTTPPRGSGGVEGGDVAETRINTGEPDDAGPLDRQESTLGGLAPESAPTSEYDGPRCDMCAEPIGPTKTRCARCEHGGAE